jgi:hypothetical protein
VTLTEEVLMEMNYNGNVTGVVVADIPVTAVTQEDPVMCDGPQNKDDFMSKQPICKVCKEKSYTRNKCREILKHTTPPHQTVYVKLIPKTVEAELKVHAVKKKKSKLEGNVNDVPRLQKFCDKGGKRVEGPSEKEKSVAVVDGSDKADDDNKEEEDYSDNITMGIHRSRTILATISASKITVKWCEEIKYPDITDHSAGSGSSSNALMMSSYMSTLNNGNSTNDHNMQWQLWDAFRAGALWAQAQQQQQQSFASSSQQLPSPLMMGSPSNNVTNSPISTSSIDQLVVGRKLDQ